MEKNNVVKKGIRETEFKTEHQQVINVINQSGGNGVGTAGFVLALISVFLGWVPVLGQILWILGLILSFAGIFRNPKGLSIAGLVISLIGVIIRGVLMVGVLSKFG